MEQKGFQFNKEDAQRTTLIEQIRARSVEYKNEIRKFLRETPDDLIAFSSIMKNVHLEGNTNRGTCYRNIRHVIQEPEFDGQWETGELGKMFILKRIK